MGKIANRFAIVMTASGLLAGCKVPGTAVAGNQLQPLNQVAALSHRGLLWPQIKQEATSGDFR